MRVKATRQISSHRTAIRSGGFKSLLEKRNAAHIETLTGLCPVPYETEVVAFEQPAISRKYTPDFPLPLENGGFRFIEAKGVLDLDERKKFQWIRASNPDLDIRFVFSNANAKISKTSKTTYAAWCDKNEFLWADKLIPEDWLEGVIRG